MAKKKTGQFKKGWKGGPGRPKKADEQVLVDLWDEAGKAKFQEAVNDGKEWAIKLLVNKIYPDKKSVDVPDGINLNLNFDKSFKDKSND